MHRSLPDGVLPGSGWGLNAFTADDLDGVHHASLEVLETVGVRVEDSEEALEFLSSGGATVKNSVISDFRMEFDIRLDAPLESDIAFAMINFRNYVN